MSKEKKSRSILVAHFNDHVALGKGLVPKSHVLNGEILLGESLTISEHDATFLRIDYKVTGNKRDYAEFIPWAQIAKIIFED